ncbi:MAG: hypothetical protein U9Q33_01335 [Campylobacterota bacterium]|nr:hypothetical protein [Campylobacterota bacterium]
MFQKIIIEIIKRVENLTEEKRSIVELDIVDIKDKIQETLFKIDFTQDSIDDIDLEDIKSLSVTPKEALGLFFLSFVTTLRSELSYNSIWLDIVDILTEFEEDTNRFFVDNYIDEDSEPTVYLSEALKDAVVRFKLRDGYDTKRPTDTILLQTGILNRFKDINYWLTSTSKNSIVENLTDRSSENFSNTFNSGWKTLQRYSRSLISKEDTLELLKQNIWFKDFDLDELLNSSKQKLHTTLISIDEIENSFFLKSVVFKDEKLRFNIEGDDFYILNLSDDNYDIFVDGEFKSKLLKDKIENRFYLENSISIEEPENYKIKIEIKNNRDKTVYQEEFVLFDFNHDILLFDEDGKWYKDHNSKLEDRKNYSILIDSDFEVDSELNNMEDNIHEYFDGYVHLITNITKDSNINIDDGDLFRFSLNFRENIKTPAWLNNLELYALSDYLSFDEAIQYQLRYNRITVSARQTDELIDIEQDASIVRWSYNGGVVYDLDSIENFNYKMDLSYDILINRKNSLKIKVGDNIFTKQLNVTLVEKTEKPKYRTFLRDINDNIKYLKETNRLTTNDIKNNQLIITSFHEEFINNPELKTQILRDKATIFDSFELNKFFTLTNYPHYGEDISSVKKIYDDVRWNTFCSISMNGIVKSYDEDSLTATLYNDYPRSSLTLITLDGSYNLNCRQVDCSSGKIDIPSNVLGFCLIDGGNYAGSYFTSEPLDIEKIFSSVDILKFLRVSYYPFGEYFNDVVYDTNRAQMQRARTQKKRDKRALRACIKNNPSVFLKAFIEDELKVGDITTNLNFDHSKTIAEQILFAIEFEQDRAVKIIQEVILNRWQEKMMQLPMFLIYLLNIIKNERYYHIFLDELPEDIKEPNDLDEEFIERMIKALLSDHKIDRYEKINIKTITQMENKEFYIQKALNRLIHISNTPVEQEDTTEE